MHCLKCAILGRVCENYWVGMGAKWASSLIFPSRWQNTFFKMWARVSSHFQFKDTARKEMEVLEKPQNKTMQQMKFSNEKLRGKPDKTDHTKDRVLHCWDKDYRVWRILMPAKKASTRTGNPGPKMCSLWQLLRIFHWEYLVRRSLFYSGKGLWDCSSEAIEKPYRKSLGFHRQYVVGIKNRAGN